METFFRELMKASTVSAIVDESSNYEEQRRLLYILPTDDGSKTMTKLSSESLLFVEP
jgi:hypothetical protein